MRSIQPGDDVFHRRTDIPGKVVRVVANVVTVRMFDPDGSGKRIEKAYPAGELETRAEREARLEEEAEKNRAWPGKPKQPPKKPLYDV